MFSTHLPQLEQAFRSLEKSQALLITSPVGHGGGLFAKALAKAVLCENRHDLLACGQCPACHWFELSNHPDYRRLSLDSAENSESDGDAEAANAEAANESSSAKKAAKKPTQITLEALRAVGEFFTVGGHRGRGRIIVIEPVEVLNVFAANRLLKTLEEPSSGLVFLLVAETAKGILPTIRSRCQVIALPSVATSEAQNWLSQNFELDPKQAERLLKEGGGAPLLAAQLADPEQSATHRLVLEAIAALPDTGFVDIAQALQAAEPGFVFSVLQRWLDDLGRVSAQSAPRYFTHHHKRLQHLAGLTNLERITAVNIGISRERRLVTHPLNWRLFCEQTLSSYCSCFRSTS